MTKIVVFDFDGTLSKGSNSWLLIWKALDMLDYDAQLFGSFRQGKITSEEWMNKILIAYKEHKVNKKMLEEIAANTKTINNLKKLLAKLKKNNIKTYVLSSGVKNIIEIVLKDVSIYIDSIEAIDFKFDSEEILEDFIYPSHNLDDKQEFVNILIKENKIKPNELLYVGNDWNDEIVSKTGCRTLCLNAEDTDYNNKAIWHNHVETDDILDILPYV